MTPEFEARVKKAVDDGYLPGVAMLVKDKSGAVKSLPAQLTL